LLIAATSNAKADFSQNQVRYLSYFDIVNYMESVETNQHGCGEFQQDNAVVFGYSSALTGKPVSSGPNFDFLNSVLSCLKGIEFRYSLEKYLSSEVYEKLGDLYENVTSVDQVLIDAAIDELTLKLIGPEVVLVSYGHIESQANFRKLIHDSAMNMIIKKGDMSGNQYFKNVFILIHLRDEFMSY
jgi:hypothetical protein